MADCAGCDGRGTVPCGHKDAKGKECGVYVGVYIYDDVGCGCDGVGCRGYHGCVPHHGDRCPGDRDRCGVPHHGDRCHCHAVGCDRAGCFHGRRRCYGCDGKGKKCGTCGGTGKVAPPPAD